MPPDSRADGPGGPKARRTRGPASPGQRTAQPFGGTLNASPLRCAPGASVSRGRSAGTPRAAVHAGHRSSQAFRDPCRPPPTRGIGPRGGSAGLPPPAATHGASALAGVPQASRRTPPTRGLGLPRAFRRPPAGRRHARGMGLPRPAARAGPRPPAGVPRPTQVAARAGPRSSQAPVGVPRPPAAHGASASRGHSAGLPQAAATPGASASRGHSAASRRPRPPSPPAARFSRKPPCGIGSRMVYCT